MNSNTRQNRLHLRGIPPWVHLFSLGLFTLATLALITIFYLYRESSVWQHYVESKGLRNHTYTEAIFRDSVFRTRANTWSNLGYVLVGLYAIALGLWDRGRRVSGDAPYVVRQPALPILFGVACCYLGIGSGIFHASLTRWGQQLDVAAMYSPLVVIVAIHWARWIPALGTTERKIPSWPVFGLAAIIVSAALYVYKWELSSRQVMLTLIFFIGAGGMLDALTRRFSLQQRWIAIALGTLIAAFVIRQLDVDRRFTGPDAWLQGHAIWHVLTAATLGAMVFFYRSETKFR